MPSTLENKLRDAPIVFLFRFSNVDEEISISMKIRAFNFDFSRHKGIISNYFNWKLFMLPFLLIPKSFSSFPFPPILRASTTPHSLTFTDTDSSYLAHFYLHQLEPQSYSHYGRAHVNYRPVINARKNKCRLRQ